MPQPFTLIVKGDPAAAARAAGAHSTKIHHSARIVDHPGTTLAIAEAEEKDLHTWFCEETEAPYPTGSLLFFSPRENYTRFSEMGVPR
jgi:hypothetical protein